MNKEETIKNEDAALSFLQDRKLIKEGCKKFIISGDFGSVCLNDLLIEFAEEQKNKSVQCMSCEKTIPKQEALVYCGECGM